MESEKYLPELMAEKDTLDPSFQHSLRLLDQEIEKVQKDEDKDDEKFIDVVINKNMKLGQKILIPVKQFPKFNFVGKLLGPRGNSLKRLQEDTLTKMSILGKGSMREKEKEEELRQSNEGKYNHLNEDLHVLIEVFAPPAEAYARMGHALEEIKKFLIPDYNDEIRQAQLQELTFLNGGSEDAKVPSDSRRSPPLHAAVPRGAAPRGAPPSRAPSSRGRAVQRARGAPPTAGYRPAPPLVQDTYGEYEYDDGYGTAYDDQGYESYDNNYSTHGQKIYVTQAPSIFCAISFFWITHTPHTLRGMYLEVLLEGNAALPQQSAAICFIRSLVNYGGGGVAVVKVGGPERKMESIM
ncbi:hypothetical protein F7725_024754 [Dissostichus mawsoni]|uniref:K Homology domain-containing protein n=1 Tax=Dissostichus mawsoni TaxID=36200 RepID=A0A7J5X967_DISMA|nr:hypothetical protein F7725_024754 [Dissostichus mawsoni]